MAGQLTIDQLKASSGVLATQNGMTGIAKAWVNFDGYNSPYTTIRSAFNVSSITYVTTGTYTINFTTAMPNANYVPCGMSNNAIIVAFNRQTTGVGTAPTTTALSILTMISGGATYNATDVCVAVFSS